MALPDLGVANSLRPASGWNLDFSQMVAQAPAGTKVTAERMGVRVYQVFGKSFAGPPQPQDVVNQLVSQGVAHEVYYLEIWESDNTFLGTGYNDYMYIAVYS